MLRLKLVWIEVVLYFNLRHLRRRFENHRLDIGHAFGRSSLSTQLSVIFSC
jgi:hypothetical protein